MIRALCCLTILTVLLLAPVQALEVGSTFVPQRACPALQSIKQQTNPGNVRLEPGRSYQVLEANRRDDPTHLRLVVPGAEPQQRWVEITCRDPKGTATAPAEPVETPLRRGTYVLAASWQPGFCETQPEKVECLNQTEARFDASHFALHGLWPQPRGNEYCGVDAATRAADTASGWRSLPPVRLSAETRRELEIVMPGTASFLERHEWIVHGTCSGGSMESYYDRSLALMQALNASTLRLYLAERIGRTLTPHQIRTAADAAFGRGAGNRIRIQCKTEQDGHRVVLTELQIQLSGDLGGDIDLADLILAAPRQDSNARQCPSVVIDRAGL
jgi:ribonuclease T2